MSITFGSTAILLFAVTVIIFITILWMKVSEMKRNYIRERAESVTLEHRIIGILNRRHKEILDVIKQSISEREETITEDFAKEVSELNKLIMNSCEDNDEKEI